jgi:RND family efflux transporter MFP subunit
MKNLTFYLILTIAAGYLQSCKSAKDKSAESTQNSDDVVSVKTAPVIRKKLNIPIHVSGVLASNAEIKLSFKIGGVIDKIFVQEGAFVRKGQVLAQLNLSEISSQVNQARVSVEKSTRDLNRVKNLYADSVSTLEQVQNATTGLDVARANLQIAEFNQRYAVIIAPANGRILKRYSEPNEITSPGNPVFLLSSSDEAWVVTVGLTDRDVLKIKENDKAQLNLDAYPGETFDAFVSQIDQTTNRQSGTYEVKLQIDTKGKRMISGLVAKGQIETTSESDELVIPIEALSEADGHKGYVFVLNSDGITVKKLPVVFSDIYQKEVGITIGLEAGQQVIVAGVSYLAAESKVKVAK